MLFVKTIGKRKCGKRKQGGSYLVGGEGEPSEDGVYPVFTLMNPPVPYQVPVHRGARLVHDDAIMERQPMETWWYGSSKNTEEKKSGDAWAKEKFGMTVTKRLATGECEGAKQVDEALAVLLTKVKLNMQDKRFVRALQGLAMEDAQELPRVLPHYDALLAAFQGYHKEQTVGRLIDAQAAVWRIAYNLPPTKRQSFIPNLIRLLVLLNLGKDAAAMQRMFI